MIMPETNKPMQDQTLLVKQAIAAFAAKIRQEVDAAKAGSVNAENAQRLEGLTLNEIVELIAGTTGLTIQDVQDQLDAFVARTDNPHNVTAAQVGLGSLDNFGTASQAETVGSVYTYTTGDGQTAFSGADDSNVTLVIGEGEVVFATLNGDRVLPGNISVNHATDTVTLTGVTVAEDDVVTLRVLRADQFVTPAGTWSALEAFLAELVGTAPETLNTIEELAAAFEQNADMVAAINDAIATKATKTYVDDEVARLEGLIEAAEPEWATEAEALAGVETNKAMSPATTQAVRLDIEAGVIDSLAEIEQAFADALAALEAEE
jgi:hypothetical protein